MALHPLANFAHRHPSPPHLFVRGLNHLIILLLVMIVATGGTLQLTVSAARAQEGPVTPESAETVAAPDAVETASSVPESTLPVPGMQIPNGLAVDPITHRVYVTSRDNDRLIMLDGFKYTVLGQTEVGDSPWGVAVDSTSRRVYAASFSGGDLRIFNADTLAPIGTVSIGLGGQFTNVATSNSLGLALVVSHRDNKLTVVNGLTGALVTSQPTGGSGAWGVAYNPNLHRAYVSHRESGNVTTLDGATGWTQLTGQTLQPCGSGGQPYGLAFNPLKNRLYIACAPAGSVNVVKVYTAAASGLSFLASVAVGAGGNDGGGGIAINSKTGNVFFTNSTGNSVSVINSVGNQVVATLAAGTTPFGAAVDAATGKVFVGNKTSNNLTVLDDTYPADPSLPAITLSKKTTCEEEQLTVQGRNFPPLQHATIYFNGAHKTTVGTEPNGAFTATITVPGNPGGMQTVTASELFWPWLQVSELVRTPLPDLPIIFLPGLAGSDLLAASTFNQVAWPNPALCISLVPNACLLPEDYIYAQNETIWLGPRLIADAFIGRWRYLDAIGLESDGRTPQADMLGIRPNVVVGEPLWNIAGLKDVYGGLDHFLEGIGYVDNQTLFYMPYDWRKDYIQMDQALESMINLALQRSGKDKVILLAHSTGGVVARNYLLRRGTAKVDQLITMGTPYIGTPLAAKGIEVGDDMGMGLHLGDLGIGLHPQEVKTLAQNFAGLYDLLPPALWFTPSPADRGAPPPPYLIRSRVNNGVTIQEPLNFAQSADWLRSRRNATLLNNALTFQNQGVGDLSRLTDQYFSQRIAGTNRMTPSTITYSPRETCATLCSPWGCAAVCVPLPELAFANKRPFGDDTIPLRSAIGGNLPAGDDRYYVVTDVPHMELPTNPNVQFLIFQMVEGLKCGGGGLPDGLENASMEVTGTEITLMGTAALNIYDTAGNHAGPLPDQPAGTENHLPGVDYSPGTDSAVATITAGGPYRITVVGTELNGAALLRVSHLDQGETEGTEVFAGIPITGTTVATLTLAGPGQPPSPMQISYAPGVPVSTNPGVLLTGAAAEDLTPPVTTVTLNWVTNMVTVAANDGPNGSGVAGILVSSESPPVHYEPYSGAFSFPAGARCVAAVATDNAGNSSPAAFACRSWLPMVRR